MSKSKNLSFYVWWKQKLVCWKDLKSRERGCSAWTWEEIKWPFFRFYPFIERMWVAHVHVDWIRYHNRKLVRTVPEFATVIVMVITSVVSIRVMSNRFFICFRIVRMVVTIISISCKGKLSRATVFVARISRVKNVLLLYREKLLLIVNILPPY